MANNPSYVRLSDRMVHGLVVDMESGWSISGFDVKEFPEDREQARFVKQRLNSGVLERASEAEYDEAHPESDDEETADAQAFVEAVQVATGKRNVGRQEHRVRSSHQERQQAVRNARFAARLEEEGIDVDDFDPDAYEYALQQKRRKQAIEEQSDEITDDPEEQKEKSATRASKKAGGSRKQSAKSKGGKSKDDDDESEQGE